MELFLAMFGVGLVTSVHCVAMCGTMVLTYAVGSSNEGGWKRRLAPHAAYQTAKLLSYMLVGLALGTIGAAFDFGGLRGWVTVLAGAFMVLLGLNMTGRVPWLRRLTLRPPKFLLNALSKTRSKAKADAEEGRSSLTTPATFGMLTGLMPCGPLQAAQLAAAATGSAATGAVAMLGFGLGTAPLMLGFGAVSGMLSGRFKQRMNVAAAVLIMILGLVMLDRGAMLVGSPVNFASVKQVVLGGPAPSVPAGDYARGEDGVVEIPLTISNVRFQPSALSIPAGEPVRLIVDRQESNACSDQLAIPRLGVLADLAPNGVTVVELPASSAGSYVLTCGMGMMSGQVIAGGGGAPAGGTATGPLVAGIAVAAGLLFLLRRNAARATAVSGGARGKGSGTSAPQGGVLGLSPTETVLLGGAVSVALIAGLVLGGMFR